MTSNILNIKTDDQLLKAIHEAATKKLSPRDLLEQRVSFVFGSLNPANGVTRERVKEVIEQQAGA